MIEYTFGVVGAGNMGTAILRGVVNSGVLDAKRIVAYDPNLKREQELALDLGILCSQDNRLPAGCPHVLLAVKPQVACDVLREIAPAVEEQTTFISIVAGLPTSRIDELLGGKGHIVRAMPNTPMLVGAGVTAIAAGPRAGHEDIHWAQRLFAASGMAVVMKEEMMDAVTGLSGSGPAYLYFLIESMIEAGVREGMDPEIAEMLATQTCIGAGKLLATTRKTPKSLREMVTTPGGTTEAALNHMNENRVHEIIAEAVSRATRRCRELGAAHDS